MNELILGLPDGLHLQAVAYGGDYPTIQIFLNAGDTSELICFAEYNLGKQPARKVCVGAYQSDKEDTTYYEPFLEQYQKNLALLIIELSKLVPSEREDNYGR